MPHIPSVAVISCTWQRPERFDRTMTMLEQQSNKQFDLYIINNNPQLHDLVNERVRISTIPANLSHREQNRGPYSRIETMYELGSKYDFYLTLDDDADVTPEWVESWFGQLRDDAVMGWSGFKFTGSYWERTKVQPGGRCHYLWGSNMAVPSDVVDKPGILNLSSKYWQADDLWLCFWANYFCSKELVVADIDVKIEIDGKDTYLSQHDTKMELLSMLRNLGWRV